MTVLYLLREKTTRQGFSWPTNLPTHSSTQPSTHAPPLRLLTFPLSTHSFTSHQLNHPITQPPTPGTSHSGSYQPNILQHTHPTDHLSTNLETSTIHPASQFYDHPAIHPSTHLLIKAPTQLSSKHTSASPSCLHIHSPMTQT